MTFKINKRAKGAVLVFALITVLLMSILGGTLMKTGLFHERLTTNNHLDALTFQAAESVIVATMQDIDASPRLRKKLMNGQLLQNCVSANGKITEECDDQQFPTTAHASKGPLQGVTLANLAMTHYQGASSVPGFAIDALAYHRFSTEGRAYFAAEPSLPFGHLNVQVWQTVGATTGVFNQQ